MHDEIDKQNQICSFVAFDGVPNQLCRSGRTEINAKPNYSDLVIGNIIWSTRTEPSSTPWIWQFKNYEHQMVCFWYKILHQANELNSDTVPPLCFYDNYRKSAQSKTLLVLHINHNCSGWWIGMMTMFRTWWRHYLVGRGLWWGVVCQVGCASLGLQNDIRFFYQYLISS